ncbi:septum formation initiator family protein [bacterium]|nr:septum formation initiator family protein [bacterium]
MTRNNSLFFRILSSKLFFIVFLLIVIYLAINVYGEFKKRSQVKKEISDLQMEIKDLEKENSDLLGLIGYFETDEYVESFSREKLGYKKPGEKIIIFTEDDSGIINYTEDVKNGKIKVANIKLWWNYFFK